MRLESMGDRSANLLSGQMMTLLEGYDGPVDPTLGSRSFSRQTLADLGREYLLMGHHSGTRATSPVNTICRPCCR